MSSARGNNSPSAWESHKDTVLELYRAKSLKEVQKEMQDRHHFQASSSQYQKQFKYWKVRKNRTESEWKQYFAARDVGFGSTPGELLPVIGRDLRKSSKRAKRWVSMPPPPDVTQRTGSTLPATEADRIPTPAAIVPVVPQNISQADIQSPFSSFSEALQASGTPLINNNTRNSNMLMTGGLQSSSQQTIFGATSDLGPWDDFNIADSTSGSFQMTSNFQSLDFGPDSFGSDLFSPIDFTRCDNMALTFPSQDITFRLDLPFASLESFLRSKHIVIGNSLLGLIHSGLASRSITATLPSRDRPIALQPAALQIPLRKLGSVIPGESFDIITDSQAFETNFVRMLSFSMLNGFAGLNDVPMEDILRFLNRFAGKLFLDILEQCPPHVSRSLSDNVFRAAIDAADAKLVKLLLERGLVDANETVCFHDGRKCTAIERAAILGSSDLVRSLIDGNADVEMTFTGGWEHEGVGGGALAKLVGRISSESRQGRFTTQAQLIEIFQQLVSAGARARPEFLHFAHSHREEALFTLLAMNMRPETHRTLFEMTPNDSAPRNGFLFRAAAEVMDDHNATTWFRDTFGHCNQLCNNICLTNGIELLHHAALEAARTGKAGLVKLLLEKSCINPRDPGLFTAAISSQALDLVEFILGFGPDLDPPAVSTNPQSQSSLLYTTPIAEAVRYGNKGLMQQLEAGGALDHLNEGGRYSPLLIAAAQAGDKDYVNKLLRQPITSQREEREEEPRSHARALVLAAEGGHREIVRMLLQAGAAQCGSQRYSTHPQALLAATRHQDTQMMRDLIVFQVQAQYRSDFSENLGGISAMGCSFMMIVVEEYPGTVFPVGMIQPFLGQCIKTDNMLLFKTVLQTLETDSLVLDDCLENAIEFRHLELVEYLRLGIIERVIPDRPDLLRTLFKQDRRRQTIPACIGSNALKSVIGDGEGDSEALNLLIETHAINFTRLEKLDTPLEDAWFKTDEIDGDVYGDDAFTPLGLAIVGSPERPGTNMTAIEKFLQAGADPNGIARARGRNSKFPPLTTALVLAVGTSWEDAVEMLLRHGALVDARPRLGTTRTALQHAAEIGDASMVKLLLDHHANADDTAPACGGATALQFAAMSGNLNIAEDLLKHGSKLGAWPSQIEGRWPLEGAAEAGRLDMISFLWKLYLQSSEFGEPCAGFSDRQCLRSMHFARLNGHIGCVNLISELSGISVDRLETDDYGETWVAYVPDYI